MADCGIEVSEEELMEMRQEFQPEGSALRGRQSQGTFESQHEELDQEKPMTTAMDLIVTFGAPHQEDGSQGSKSRSQRAVTRQMQGVEFGSFDDMKETLRKEFEISELNEFQIKFVNEDGSQLELSGNNWDQVREWSQTNQIQLAIELLNQENQDKDEVEESNYDDDFEEPAPAEKVYKDAVTLDKVKAHFEELRIILQIKKVKRGDALKFILHGVKNPETDKKVKKVTLECLIR